MSRKRHSSPTWKKRADPPSPPEDPSPGRRSRGTSSGESGARDDESGADAYRAALVSGAAALGLRVGFPLREAMTLHYTLIARWGARMNLTAVTDPVAAAELHGLDSLLFSELIAPEDASLAVDVGSGAGFPGIVVALARPHVHMTLLEPMRKRASFLRVALAELERPDVVVVEGRLDRLAGREEECGRAPAHERSPWPAALILSRATLPPIALIESAAPRLSPGGRVIITSGRGAPGVAELQRVAGQVGLVHGERREWTLPGGETRILDVLIRDAASRER